MLNVSVDPLIGAVAGAIIFVVFFIIGFFTNLSAGVGLGL